MRFCHLLLCVLTCVGGLTGSPVHAGPLTPIPGTRVQLVVPQDFVVADGFAGIIWQDAGATVHVVEIPAPAEEMRRSLTKPRLASRGMALLRAEEVDASIGPATMLHVRQLASGVEFRKWMLVGGDARRTVMLTATVPNTLSDQLEAPLVDVLLTARWDPGRRVDPRSAVGFEVKETADLKIATSIMGAGLLLTQGGVQTTSDAADPFIIVAKSTAEAPIADLGVFSRRHLAETAKIAGPNVVHENELVIGGMPAHELVAHATAEGTVPVIVYQAVAFDGRHYFVIQGRVGARRMDPFLNQFREVARSLTVRR